MTTTRRKLRKIAKKNNSIGKLLPIEKDRRVVSIINNGPGDVFLGFYGSTRDQALVLGNGGSLCLESSPVSGKAIRVFPIKGEFDVTVLLRDGLGLSLKSFKKTRNWKEKVDGTNFSGV